MEVTCKHIQLSNNLNKHEALNEMLKYSHFFLSLVDNFFYTTTLDKSDFNFWTTLQQFAWLHKNWLIMTHHFWYKFYVHHAINTKITFIFWQSITDKIWEAFAIAPLFLRETPTSDSEHWTILSARSICLRSYGGRRRQTVGNSCDLTSDFAFTSPCPPPSKGDAG